MSRRGFSATVYFPPIPLSLPTPVTKSYPALQLKLPADPETMSRKSLVFAEFP